ncbi:glycerophosphoryl diester phosphodiesterase [Trypanosoma conorhini]|uniref:Glycerophosphoryl diester phosphodiesterase n=1 Tax=Trypanosoma conorhini TaxID=83891 RepID=A0A3R7L6G7_9TRYP|nr:glycerophosphoryl diester phosphodiesterase [Trypanosoma conorhini]RNF22010.1 glycerophosphoryl diester phosphodiesterase [Trypanosoma conorhini]
MKSVFLASSVAVAAGWAYVRHMQLPAGPTRLDWGARVFGHRGCRGVPGVPENTLDAFKYALSRGVAGIEVDVRLTKDNELAIFHDVTCNGHLKGVETKTRIDELTLLELKRLPFQADPTGQIRLPTLEESLLFCRENNLKMLIEIKEMRRARLCADKVLDLYHRYPDYMYDHTVVVAFSPAVLYYVRRRDRNVAVGQIHSGRALRTWIRTGTVDVPWYARLCPAILDWLLNYVQESVNPWVSGVSLMCPHYELFSEAYKRRWHTRKIGVALWGFSSPAQCTREMRAPGVLIESDDQHEEFATPKQPANFDIFGDKAREREREEEEQRRRLKLEVK